MNIHDVFISYSRKDSDVVFPIVKRLEEEGLKVWIDRDGIESGDAFKSVIVGGIKKSDIFLFFSSANANESPWTVKEVNTAVYLKKSIIPVKLDGADYADSILFDLVGLDFVDLSIKEKNEAELNKLIASLLSKKPTEKKEGFTNLLKAAQDLFFEKTTTEECYKRGWDYYEKKRYVDAFSWYKKAAEQGYVLAQAQLGYMYEVGEGIEKDYNQAEYWYKKAAEQGYAYAQCNLGEMYEFGRNLTNNYCVRIETKHGKRYLPNDNNIVRVDYKQAEHWYKKAAEQGYARAQCNLGEMYLEGRWLGANAQWLAIHGQLPKSNRSVITDRKQAEYWFRKAAEQKYALAQVQLGNMYEFGKGVKKDYRQAVYWYKKATEQGNADAKKKLKELEGKF